MLSGCVQIFGVNMQKKMLGVAPTELYCFVALMSFRTVTLIVLKDHCETMSAYQPISA